ncbi:MAG: hypothetical protein V1863_00735 [Candidatus Omnitrophota bacterium]
MNKFKLDLQKIFASPEVLKWLSVFEKWKAGKKYFQMILPFLVLGAFGTLMVGASSPILLQLIKARQDIDELDLKMKGQMTRIIQVTSFDKETLKKESELLDERFLPRQSFSYYLENLTKLGETLGIKFLAINPGNETPHTTLSGPLNYTLVVFPIHISMQSEYRNFGEFLGRLVYFSGAMVVVKNYVLTRDENILPRLNISLELGVCFLKPKK